MVLGLLTALAMVLTILFARDALLAADQRAEIPAELVEELVADAEDPSVAEGLTLRSEYSPREARDPSPLQAVSFTPEHIFIPEAGVNTTVRPRASTTEFNPFIGRDVLTFPVPDDAFTTVWWDEGPSPGDDGLAVILGHARTPRAAVFNDLPDLRQGATLGLTGRTGQGQDVTARYRVEQVVAGISKTDAAALRTVLDNPPPGATLALITCSGDLDEVLSSRVDNTVVFASLLGMHPSS